MSLVCGGHEGISAIRSYEFLVERDQYIDFTLRSFDRDTAYDL